MRTTIDSAGRIVIPKALREAAGLRAGAEVEVTLRNGCIEIDPAPPTARLVERNGRLVFEAEHEVPVLTADEVRDIVERVRR
jgi:AbrB family looped-hinge helix DNA binding protein